MNDTRSAALPRQQTTDVRKARIIAGNKEFGAGFTCRPSLVVAHRHRGVRVLHREGATETAAMLGVGKLDELDTAYRFQQTARAVTDPQHPQRMTGRVVGDAMREGRPDIGDAEDIDQELGELVYDRGEHVDVGLQLRISCAHRDVPVLVTHRADAGGGRRYDRVEPVEGCDEVAYRRYRLLCIAGIDEHLPAAGLLDREFDVASESPQQSHNSFRRLREQHVVEAGGQQRDPHAHAGVRRQNRFGHLNTIITANLSDGPPPRVILAGMADKVGRTPVRTGGERIRKLAQAAMNADVTVEQVDTILEGLSETLNDLNHSTANLDATLVRFNDTISRINELAPRLHGVVDRMEGVVGRVERIVGIGESVISPLTATDQAIRGVVSRLRHTAGL